MDGMPTFVAQTYRNGGTWKPPRGRCLAGFASGATSKLPAVAVCTVRRYCSYVLVRSWPPAVLPTLGRQAQQAQAAQARGLSVLPMLAMPALCQASVHACVHAAFACLSACPVVDPSHGCDRRQRWGSAALTLAPPPALGRKWQYYKLGSCDLRYLDP